MRLFCVDDVRLVCVPSPAAPVRRAHRAKVTRVEPRCLLKKSLRFKQPSKGRGEDKSMAETSVVVVVVIFS